MHDLDIDQTRIGHATPMSDFGQFRTDLREALNRLHDPGFVPTDIIYEVVGCDSAAGAAPLQARLIAEISEFQPPPDVSPDNLESRVYTSLSMRYLQECTQEETAAQLHISTRHAQRIQAEATHVLARRLWQRWSDEQPAAPLARNTGDQSAEDMGVEPVPASAWHAQMEREMASLDQRHPQATAGVGDAIEESTELIAVLAERHGTHIAVGFIQPDLVAEVHPSALRQTLITALSGLLSHVAGPITIYAGLEHGDILITLTGPESSSSQETDKQLKQSIALPSRAAVDVRHEDGHVFVWLKFPAVGGRTVLVVEDNPDMVHFFRRSTAGTPYRIVHIGQGAKLYEAIEATHPDIIVLDVMLPDVDGWKLLTHLREAPASLDIPIIVCSVIKEEELALALGAKRFLSKPVQPRLFVETLNQVLDQE